MQEFHDVSAGEKETKFSGLLYITKNRKISCVLYAHSQFVCSRVATLAFLMPDFAILAVFEHLWLFLEIKEKGAYFQSDRLGSRKTLSELHMHYKSLLQRGSITMQGAQNIAKILRLP